VTTHTSKNNAIAIVGRTNMSVAIAAFKSTRSR